MTRLPEPEATQHHSRIVNALVTELEHYGVQALAGMIATLIENDPSPDAQVWAIKFRKMEAAPGQTLITDSRPPQDAVVVTATPPLAADDKDAFWDTLQQALWPLISRADTDTLKWFVRDANPSWLLCELAARALDARGLRCGFTHSRMRCQLDAGHGPYHKHNAAGWEQ